MLLPTIRAGVPTRSKAVYHAVRFLAHDPMVYLTVPTGDRVRRILIVRDVELERARKLPTADKVYCPADFAPPEGLSGDREIATAQAAAVCVTRHGIRRVLADRSLPLVFAEHLKEAGVEVVLDLDLGVTDRRRKDETEVAALRQAQQDTETAIALACRIIRHANARADGVLMHDGEVLTSERVKAIIDQHLAKLGYGNDGHIIAGGPIGADCHHAGAGELRTGEPVLVDVFPQNKTTLYHGDCTRTVVHGDVPPLVQKMHDIVAEAKKAAEGATRAGTTGDAVHRATAAVMEKHGVYLGFLPSDAPANQLFLPHGTGHGLGLDLKEPPLLDYKGVELLAGDAVTIEPALYAHGIGGVRLEDMYIVRDNGYENLDTLPETLTEW
ncbi:MAG: M24 family metallopeptidase [Tepidisphaeraceae bacterium]